MEPTRLVRITGFKVNANIKFSYYTISNLETYQTKRKFVLPFPTFSRRIFILIIPAIILILSVILKLTAGPLWQYCDPCYQYLFNALHMVKGMSPTYIDHPGTPLHLLIFFIIKILNIGHSSAQTLNNVLITPEFYLSVVNIILILFSFLISVCLGAYIYHKTQDLTAVFLTQLPGLSFPILQSYGYPDPFPPIVANVNPELLLIGITSLFNLTFLRLFFSKTQKTETRSTVLIGFICGLGLATKINFFPLLLPVLICLSWQRWPIFILTCSLSFILWTLPILYKYPVMGQWLLGILNHTGAYGMGSQGIIDWHEFFAHLFKDIFNNCWLYVLSIGGIFIYSSIQMIKNRSNRTIRFQWAAALGVLLQITIVAKHFSLHYLVPGIGLCGSVFFLFYIDKMMGNKRLKIMITLFIVLFILENIRESIVCSNKYFMLTNDIHSFQERIYSKYPACTIIASHSKTMSLYLSQNYALFFGNRYSSHRENQEILETHPHSYYFNPDLVDSDTDSYGIWNSNNRVFADDLLSSSACTIFIAGHDFTQSPFLLRQIETSTYANAYLLLGSTEKEANELFSKAEDFLNKGNYPTAFALALKSRELNYQPRNKVELLMTIIYHKIKK
ncbi:MAG: hypothetical protein HQL15_02420 [Candidatus Omnitrophica bacterium]|nr:hypothetical protein [Candidatus Omnitrophota bacterium]